MSKPASKTAQFLAAMRQSETPESQPAAAPVAAPQPMAPTPAVEAAEPRPATVHAMPRAKAAKAQPATRAGLKHFGGYLDDDTLEKIALLRVRLKKDNSELIKQAIDDLYRKHNAKRAFGDA